jgi:16S rRNA (cytosine967-C5)-methyltransferase
MSAKPKRAPAASARALAVRAVINVTEEDLSLDAALERVLANAGAASRSAVRSLTYGAIRGYFRYEAVLSRLLSQPVESIGGSPRALLSVALFELEDARTPEYAVVDAAVTTARALGLNKLSGLINAVLRRYLRERAVLDAELARNPIVRHGFPDWIAQRLRTDWPIRWTQILAACDRQAPMWLRINRRRVADRDYLAQLRAAGIGAQLADGVPHAVVLDAPCEVEALPGFAQGFVSVQDLAAQCVAFPLDLAAGQRVLDACAAPGGKTALIAEHRPDLKELVAIDVDPNRLQRVADNLRRTGADARLIAADAGQPAVWWDGKPFDRILLDAPCSALGVIRRHPDIRIRRRSFDIEKFATTQAALLRACWGMLAPGGRLVYATCTLTRRENHDVMAVFAGETADAEMAPSSGWLGWPGLGESDGFGVQIIPGEAAADGFYYAAVSKK